MPNRLSYQNITRHLVSSSCRARQTGVAVGVPIIRMVDSRPSWFLHPRKQVSYYRVSTFIRFIIEIDYNMDYMVIFI